MSALHEFLPAPRLLPDLDPGFRPAVLAWRAFQKRVVASGAAVPLVLAAERDRGRVSRFETAVFHPSHPDAVHNGFFVERLVKFLLWQWGGWKVTVGGPAEVAETLRRGYAPGGARNFDRVFWGEKVYNRPFTVVHCRPEDVPPATPAAGGAVKLDWHGWRIGFDLGASDRKIAVVRDGKLALNPDGTPLLSAEFVWNPKPQADAAWHFAQILEILKLAEAKIKEADPQARVAAIGGSSAGIYVENRVRVASLFRGVPEARFETDVAPIFLRLQEAMGGMPFRLENDGDVTALAGAIALRDGAVLGLAMGSSLAAGYVDESKHIAGWMNELAFAPVDYQPDAPADEWSGDRGVGASYFSQQAVGRLIPRAGIGMPDLPADALPERLKRVQELMAAGDPRARRIYATIGRWLGYATAQYAGFYRPLRHVEILGRVMTGTGGRLILDEARAVLAAEFPELAGAFDFYEPSEMEKRHGQAAAAASLPLDRHPTS